jgi:hypothetical protein
MAPSTKYLCLFVFLLTAIFGYSQTWRPIGPVPGPEFGPLNAVASYKGDIIVGGDFVKVRSGFERVARWDGTEWHEMGDGLNNQFLLYYGSDVHMLESYHDTLFAGGCFYNFNRLAYLVRWDSDSWKYFHDSSGTGGCVYTSFKYGDSLFLGGSSAFGWGNNQNNRTGMVGLWYNGKMNTMGRGMHSAGKQYTGVKAITADDSSVYAGGTFYLYNDTREHRLVRWDGENWTPMADSINGEVNHLVSYKGSLYVSGRFTKINNDSIAWLARWDGQDWHDVPGADIKGILHASAVYRDVLYLGGHFTGHAEGDTVAGLIAFDGEKWFSPALFNSSVYDMKIVDDELVMAGNFSLIDSLPVYALVALNIPGLGLSDHVIQKLTLYPNPTQKEVFIQISPQLLPFVESFIVDIHGRRWETHINQQNHSLRADISHLPNGFYQFVLKTRKQIFMGKFVKY